MLAGALTGGLAFALLQKMRNVGRRQVRRSLNRAAREDRLATNLVGKPKSKAQRETPVKQPAAKYEPSPHPENLGRSKARLRSHLVGSRPFLEEPLINGGILPITTVTTGCGLGRRVGGCLALIKWNMFCRRLQGRRRCTRHDLRARGCQ
jgi:hypothetical protein